jgi:hypothetical protein
VFIGKLNAADLFRSNLNGQQPADAVFVQQLGLNDYGGKFKNIVEYFASIKLPEGWTTVVNDSGVVFKNAELKVETDQHPLKTYFQAIIDRENTLNEPIDL